MSDTSETTLDLYKLAVEMADRVSARRGGANQFYLTLETLILGVPAAFELGGGGTGADAHLVSLSIVGILVAVVWWLQLRSYRSLNRAKFQVILAIERDQLPLALFGDEWKHLKNAGVPGWRGRYAELGFVESVVPGIFVLLQVLLLVGVGW